MARELGMNPRKFGKLANHDQEPWKLPLPQFIESLYLKRFGRDRPAVVLTLEEHARQQERKKAARTAARKRAREESKAGEEAQAVVDGAIKGPCRDGHLHCRASREVGSSCQGRHRGNRGRLPTLKWWSKVWIGISGVVADPALARP